MQAELHQLEAPQFKDLHTGVLHVVWRHVNGQGGQVWGSPMSQQAVEPVDQGVLKGDAQALKHLTNQSLGHQTICWARKTLMHIKMSRQQGTASVGSRLTAATPAGSPSKNSEKAGMHNFE
jgi:hypothetical protein